MQILTVIPIGKAILADFLTYFTKENVQIGNIIKIPLRKKIVYGLVVNKKPAEEMKGELKSLPFAIKKIEKLHSENFFKEGFMTAIKKVADFNASSFGSAFFSLIPKIIFETKMDLKRDNVRNVNNYYETILMQSDSDERFSAYKSIIREEFAKGNSVFFLSPNIEDLLNAKFKLEKGIEKHTFLLHSKLGKKELLTKISEIIKENHPVLILVTGNFVSIPRDDIGLIIMDKEGSKLYKMQTRPFIDIRHFVRILARELKIRLIMGDTLLSCETFWKERNGKYALISPLKFRSISSANCRIYMNLTAQDMKKKEFKAISEELKTVIENAVKNSESTFLFCARKGLAPHTVCSDCGTVFLCKNCGKPVVLYGKDRGFSKNIFICNNCGEKYDSETKCRHCGGWRLSPLGIGAEKVKEEILSFLPKAKIFIFNKDYISSQKRAEKIRDNFFNTPGSIMIGTEMALPFLNQKIENSAVVSIDSYFSIPDFQINEKIFRNLIEMRNMSTKEFIIQTRQENIRIFEYAIKGNLSDFYKDEIEERKLLEYPPFGMYVKFSLSGERSKTRKEMEELKSIFAKEKVQIFDSFTSDRGKYTANAIISINRESWPNEEILKKIKNLSPRFVVRIDPASLL